MVEQHKQSLSRGGGRKDTKSCFEDETKISLQYHIIRRFNPLFKRRTIHKERLCRRGQSQILTKIYRSDKNGLAVYQPQIEEGEWFSGNIPEDGSLPLIVSRQFLEESGLKHPIGKKIQYGNYTYTVTGVISGIKNNPFTPSTPTIVLPINDKQDASFGGFDVKIIDSDIDTYVQDLYKEFRKEFPDPLDTPTIDRIEQWKIGEILETIISVSLQAIPTLFLLVFAFIGTFGLFWVHSRKRKSEYALRMAIGSTRFRMIYLVIMESLVITCLAMLPGLILFCYISDFTRAICSPWESRYASC